MTDSAETGDPMRERILRAAFKVLSRHGYGKFNLSDVAAQAGISRPTHLVQRTVAIVVIDFRDKPDLRKCGNRRIECR